MFDQNNLMSGHAATPQFRVVKSAMVASGTYNQEYTRPYESNISSDTLESYNIMTQNGQQVTRNTLAGVAGSIMAPSAVADASVNVSNGWATERIIFMMEIIEVNTRLTTVLMGYADRVDLSHGGLIDPNLAMTINSTMVLNTVETVEPGIGVVQRKRVVDNAHLLGAQTNNTLRPLDQRRIGEETRVYTQRPTDVANNLSLGHMNAGIAFDGRTQIMPNQMSKSKRANNSAPVYLSEVINGIAQTASQPEMQEGHMDQQAIFMEAGNVMAESRIHNDPVMRYISRQTNINMEGFVTWGAMCTLFPGLDQATDFYQRGSNVMRLDNHFESNAGTFEYWDRVSWETVIATTIFQTLPSIISQSMLMGISGTMTNNTIEGTPDVGIEDARAFVDGFDRTKSVQNVVQRLLFEVMPGLTANNQRLIYIAFNINLVRDGWVSVSIENQPPLEFSSPCFADGLLLPTITTNENNLAQLASNVNTLVTHNL